MEIFGLRIGWLEAIAVFIIYLVPGFVLTACLFDIPSLLNSPGINGIVAIAALIILALLVLVGGPLSLVLYPASLIHSWTIGCAR